MQKGIKNDKGKTQWWYIGGLVEEFKQVIDVLEYGDSKYPADDGCNWKRVESSKRRYTSALFRHITAWLNGENFIDMASIPIHRVF